MKLLSPRKNTNVYVLAIILCTPGLSDGLEIDWNLSPFPNISTAANTSGSVPGIVLAMTYDINYVKGDFDVMEFLVKTS